MDETTRALQLIEERRNAPSSAVLTKDINPQPMTKADAETGIVEGYGSEFWMVDSWAEATAPGSFATSIRDRGPESAKSRIVLRFEHEWTIGTQRKLFEEPGGLKMEAHVSEDGMYGSAVRAHLRDGVPYGLSIGFRRVGQRPATADDPLDFSTAPPWIVEMAAQDIGQITVLTDVKLLEVSIVTFPAVDTALVTNYRSDLDLPQRHIDALLRDAKRGVLSSDHITSLRALAQSLPAASDPDPETGEPVTPQTAATRRNYLAEARLVCLEAGVPIWE
jgi:HK97 family phage prohead protease